MEQHPIIEGTPCPALPIIVLRTCRTLQQLVAQGFSVVVVEEHEAATSVTKGGRLTKPRKQRYVAGIVTPARPNYLVTPNTLDDDTLDLDDYR